MGKNGTERARFLAEVCLPQNAWNAATVLDLSIYDQHSYHDSYHAPSFDTPCLRRERGLHVELTGGSCRSILTAAAARISDIVGSDPLSTHESLLKSTQRRGCRPT